MTADHLRFQCFVLAGVASTLLQACSPAAETSSNSAQSSAPAPAAATTIDHINTTCPADTAKYAGLKCAKMRLGISLKKFRDEAKSAQLFMNEESTHYPAFQKWYRVAALPAPVAGVSWTPIAKFVDDGTAFRLYTIEGFVDSEEAGLLTRLKAKYGNPTAEGSEYIWKRGGTKLRYMMPNEFSEAAKEPKQEMLSFTDDALIDLNGDKMAAVLDSQ
jgi:hypothetical protein